MVGPGDYTNFTEADVIAMAKVLTGWQVPAISSTTTLTAQFAANRHSTGNKKLSARFNNAEIKANDKQEYKDMIDVILSKRSALVLSRENSIVGLYIMKSRQT